MGRASGRKRKRTEPAAEEGSESGKAVLFAESGLDMDMGVLSPQVKKRGRKVGGSKRSKRGQKDGKNKDGDDDETQLSGSDMDTEPTTKAQAKSKTTKSKTGKSKAGKSKTGKSKTGKSKTGKTKTGKTKAKTKTETDASAVSHLTSRQDIIELEHKILASRKEVNGIVDLLTVASLGVRSEEDEDRSHAALLSLNRIFTGLGRGADVRAAVAGATGGTAESLKKKKNNAHKRGKGLDGKKTGGGGEGEDPKEVLRAWLQRQFEMYQRILVRNVGYANACLKIPSLETLLSHIGSALRTGQRSPFLPFRTGRFAAPRALLRDVLSAAVTGAGTVPALAKGVDVKGYASVVGPQIGEMVDSVLLGSAVDVALWSLEAISDIPDEVLESTTVLSFLMTRMMRVAESIPGPAEELGRMMTRGMRGSTKGVKGKEKRMTIRGKDVRKAYERAWRRVVTAPGLTPALYKRVLVFFDDGVLPHIQKPMAWLDFLCDAYEQPGVLPILALASMYTLITVHNVEYPDFYSKLYSVLSLESMYTVHRVEFFTKVNRFLSSTYLPNYLVASFVKRLARLALHGPPTGALTAITLMYNLMTNHPTTLSLIHQDAYVSRTARVVPIGPDSAGNDVFDPEEEDPAKTGASESSLWEIQALENHYLPRVAKAARIFRRLEKNAMRSKKLNPRAAQAELLSASLGVTYTSLISSEARATTRRGVPRKIPLAYVAPTSLFDAPSFSGFGAPSEPSERA